jgi:FkbM family methyltransferase
MIRGAAIRVGGKLRTLRRAWEGDGATGLARVVAARLEEANAPASRFADRWLRGHDNAWLGRWVELRGDRVKIEGCTFRVDAPAISTAAKGAFALGSYERPERLAIRRFLDPALPVVELGAAVGVVSCLTNRRLRDPSRHVVVEANPDLIPVLQANRDLNGCGFEILHRALAYGGETAAFYPYRNFLGSSVEVATARRVEVPATGLRLILDDRGFDRCTLICDIEGGERALVRNEGEVLAARVQTLILEVHPHLLGNEGVRRLLADLGTHGFRVVHRRRDTFVLRGPGAADA